MSEQEKAQGLSVHKEENWDLEEYHVVFNYKPAHKLHKKTKKQRKSKNQRGNADEKLNFKKAPAPTTLGDAIAFQLEKDLARLGLNDGGATKKPKKARKQKKCVFGAPSAPVKDDTLELLDDQESESDCQNFMGVPIAFKE